MKLKLAVLFLLGSVMFASAQEVKTDSSETKDVESDRLIKIKGIQIGSENSDTTAKSSSKFSFQLTLSRFDLGLATFLDQGSYTLRPENEFLEHSRWKTHNIGFEFLQTGYRFNSYFKVYLAAGFDWTHIRLKQNVTIQPEQSALTPIKEEEVDFKKNRFSSTYLRIPLAFQFRTKDDQRGNKVYFVAGPEIGFLINGKTKQVSDERGKVKRKDDFNLNPFRYGAFARFGYDNLGLYVKYYANDVFADKQGPKDFKNLNFGIMLGF